MGRRRRRPRLPEGEYEARIGHMGDDGRGVAQVDGRTTFIHGALTGETVRFRYTRRHRGGDEGRVVEVLTASPDRVRPGCDHYGVCGGCSLQHLADRAQIEAKQALLLDHLRQTGAVEPAQVLAPIIGDSSWGYRRKARLGVKDVPGKGRVLVGFRERGSSLVADLSSCQILHPLVGGLLPALSALIGSMSIRRRLPQIEVAVDDRDCVLILRILEPLSATDEQQLLDFQDRHGVAFYLQPGGPETVVPLAAPINLSYRLPAFDLTLAFQPTDFTQVNSAVNRQMVQRAVDLLQPTTEDRVLDLFCGIGNFTLPIARRCAQVVGVEGEAGLVARARANAERNGLCNTEFHAADLYGELAAEPWLQQRFSLALLDPPRSGALQVLGHLPRLGVDRIVYVSCFPPTLARDAGELVHRHGYRLVRAGVMDMFPHTAHIESIALFERE